MVAATGCIVFTTRWASQSFLRARTFLFAFSLTPTLDQFYHGTGCRGYDTLIGSNSSDQPLPSRFGRDGYGDLGSITPISHDHIGDPVYMCSQCANGRGKHFVHKMFWSEKIPVQVTNISNDLKPAGMAGLASLSPSVDMGIGPSPMQLIGSSMGSLSSRERKVVIQVFLDNPTNVPPQSAPVKWWKASRALDFCLPFTCSQMSISRCFASFPVTSFSFVSAPRCPRDTRTMSSTRTQVSGGHTSDKCTRRCWEWRVGEWEYHCIRFFIWVSFNCLHGLMVLASVSNTKLRESNLYRQIVSRGIGQYNRLDCASWPCTITVVSIGSYWLTCLLQYAVGRRACLISDLLAFSEFVF